MINERQSRIDSDISITVLDALVEDQQRDTDALPLSCKDTFETVFLRYLVSRHFEVVYEEGIERFSHAPTKGEIRELKNRFAGRVFEDISFWRVFSIVQPPYVVLSPQRTLHYFEHLHPEKPKMDLPFNHGTLKGISVPDYLIIDMNGIPQVVAMCDTSVYGNKQWDGTKVELKVLTRDRSEVFNPCELLPVYPNFSYIKGNLYDITQEDVQKLLLGRALHTYIAYERAVGHMVAYVVSPETTCLLYGRFIADCMGGYRPYPGAQSLNDIIRTRISEIAVDKGR